jgi:hypothetical protein
LSLEGDSRGMLTCDAFLPEWSAPLEIAPDSALPSARGGTVLRARRLGGI